MQLPFGHRDPASAMAEFEQILASNSGEDPFDSAIKLLSAKLIAEHKRDSSFAVHKTPEMTHRAVSALYRQALREWPSLNGQANDLEITPDHLVRSMRPLLGWRLSDSDLTWLDATLERLVARDSKGALGQYFTPRDIIRLCIDVLNPGSKDKVIDPACGSGGFLFEASRHAIATSGAAPQCLGIDFGARAIKVVALLAAATPKFKIVTSKANSIDGRAHSHKTPDEWKAFLARGVGSVRERAKSWGDWNRLGCTVLATNPPFAGDMDELEVLDAYEAQEYTSARNAVSREHLFLERSIHLLRPGGRLAIVLPQGLLANPSASYLRTWLFRKCRILGVIGLHANAFLPYTSVKTSLLFATKLDEDQKKEEHEIFFAASDNSGKDSRGRRTGIPDYNEIAAAFCDFLRMRKYAWAERYEGVKAKFEAVPSGEVMKADRLDAEYYDPHARALLRALGGKSVAQLGSVADARPDRFKRQHFKDIEYIDISSVDGKTGLATSTKIPANKAPSRASYIVQPGDVLVSTVRPDRNVIGLVTASGSAPTIASNGFCVLRSKSVEPEVVYAYCKTKFFRRMLARHATASMYPTVTDKDVLSVPFLQPSPDVAERVKELVRSGMDMLEKGQLQLEEAIALMAANIQDPEDERDMHSNSPAPQARQVRAKYRSKTKKA